MSYVGLGAYPTDPCYDATRPDWLPYWFDDLTESDCKYPNGVLSDLPQAGTNITAVAGQTVGAGAADIASGIAAGATGAATAATGNLSLGGGVVLLAIAGIGILVLMAAVKK